MATDLENLQTAKSALISKVATWSAALASAEDNQSISVDGISVTKQHLEDKIQKGLAALERIYAISQLEEQPTEIVTYGVV